MKNIEEHISRELFQELMAKALYNLRNLIYENYLLEVYSGNDLIQQNDNLSADYDWVVNGSVYTKPRVDEFVDRWEDAIPHVVIRTPEEKQRDREYAEKILLVLETVIIPKAIKTLDSKLYNGELSSDRYYEAYEKLNNLSTEANRNYSSVIFYHKLPSDITVDYIKEIEELCNTNA